MIDPIIGPLIGTNVQETPIFVIHDQEQALRVAHASQTSGGAVQLFSARGAASSLGPEVFQSILDRATQEYPSARIEGFLDCQDDAGLALSTLRRCRAHISVTLHPAAQKKIIEIAKQHSVKVSPYPDKGMDLADANYHDTDLIDHIRKHSDK